MPSRATLDQAALGETGGKRSVGVGEGGPAHPSTSTVDEYFPDPRSFWRPSVVVLDLILSDSRRELRSLSDASAADDAPIARLKEMSSSENRIESFLDKGAESRRESKITCENAPRSRQFRGVIRVFELHNERRQGVPAAFPILAVAC